MYKMRHSEAGSPVLADRREMLRVKVKSLATEARMIRHEEKRLKVRKLGSTELHAELHAHRVVTLRRHSREANLAYGLIKGRTYEQMEQRCRTRPNWEEVRRLCKKYGPPGWNGPAAPKVNLIEAVPVTA